MTKRPPKPRDPTARLRGNLRRLGITDIDAELAKLGITVTSRDDGHIEVVHGPRVAQPETEPETARLRKKPKRRPPRPIEELLALLAAATNPSELTRVQLSFNSREHAALRDHKRAAKIAAHGGVNPDSRWNAPENLRRCANCRKNHVIGSATERDCYEAMGEKPPPPPQRETEAEPPPAPAPPASKRSRAHWTALRTTAEAALRDPHYRDLSSTAVAEQLGVSHVFIARLRKHLGLAEGKKLGRDGKMRAARWDPNG